MLSEHENYSLEEAKPLTFIVIYQNNLNKIDEIYWEKKQNSSSHMLSTNSPVHKYP